MKRISRVAPTWLLSALLFIFISHAHAEPEVPAKGALNAPSAPSTDAAAAIEIKSPPAAPPPAHRLVSVALDFSRFDYAEDFPPPGKSTENGTIPSLYASYRRQESAHSGYWQVIGEISAGGTHYDGTTQKGAPVQQDTANQFYRGEFNYALALPFAKAYAGLGARLWVRGSSTVINKVASPSERYFWLYLPIGIRYEHELDENWSFAVDGSLRWMFWGTISVTFSEVASNYQDSRGSLGAHLGGRFETPVRRRVSSKLSAEIVPWFEYSTIGQGGLFDIVAVGVPTTQGYEPASRTYQYGARVGVVLNY